jgi:hypothetical protein
MKIRSTYMPPDGLTSEEPLFIMLIKQVVNYEKESLQLSTLTEKYRKSS